MILSVYLLSIKSVYTLCNSFCLLPMFVSVCYCFFWILDSVSLCTTSNCPTKLIYNYKYCYVCTSMYVYMYVCRYACMSACIYTVYMYNLYIYNHWQYQQQKEHKTQPLSPHSAICKHCTNKVFLISQLLMPNSMSFYT